MQIWVYRLKWGLVYTSRYMHTYLEGLGFSCHAKKTPTTTPPPPPPAERGANMQLIKDLDLWYAWKTTMWH